MSIFMLWLVVTAIPALNYVSGVMAVMAGISLIIAGIAFFAVWCEDGLEEKLTRRFCKLFIIIGSVLLSCITMTILAPNKTEMAVILAGHYTTNIEGIEELPPALIKFINKQLESEEE